MKLITTTLIFCILLLLLSSSVYSQDFALFSGKFYDLKEGEEKIGFEFYNGTYSICENDKKIIPILIANTGDNVSKYSFDVFGASWASLNANEFSLPKKQSGILFLSLSPKQNAEGSYNVQVNALSSLGNVKKGLGLDVNVEKCYSLELELEKEQDKICSGAKSSYDGEIINDGKKEIDVELALNAPSWATLNKNIFSVPAESKQKFELMIEAPSNAIGSYNIFLSAVAKDASSLKPERRLSLELVPKYDCYKADIIADSKITNYYSNSYTQIKIMNSGIKQADYDISLEAPDWIGIEPNKITINPEHFGNLNLNIAPSSEIPEGDYEVKINVKFDDATYTKNIKVVLSKNEILEKIRLFFILNQYYIYLLIIVIVILFFSRKRIKTAYKNYQIKQARLRALELARKAKKEKLKNLQTHNK